MNRTTILITLLIISVIVTLVFFMIQGGSRSDNQIIHEGNTMLVPIDMAEDGAPPLDSIKETYP